MGPNVSTATDWKKAEYLSDFRIAANSAAEPASLAEASTYDSAVGPLLLLLLFFFLAH